MSTVPTRQNVVSFEARRSERTSVDAERQELDELRRSLEAERAALADERRRLEKREAEFEDELAVLEEQRHFLDAQREKLRREAAALEGERESLDRGRAIASQRERVETALDEARRARESEKARLQAEMAGLLQHVR